MNPTYDNGETVIYCGHAPAVLRTRPAESVQCCVCSPPYWSLRDYGIEPDVWGGDEQRIREGLPPLSSACAAGDHYSGEEIPPRPGRGNKPGDFSTSSLTNPQRQDEVPRPTTAGQLCPRCGAWLGCLGLEPTPALYVKHVVEVFREVRRVLRKNGLLFLNLGDSYATSGPGTRDPEGWPKQSRGDHCVKRRSKSPPGLKPKDLVGIPWAVAFALRDDGWYLRQWIPWLKRNPMPGSPRDRPPCACELVFLLSKGPRPFYDPEAIRRPTRAWRNSDAILAEDGRILVYDIPAKSYKEAHFATYPVRLVEPCILAGTSARGACPNCGAPWLRVVQRKRVRTRPGTDSKINRASSKPDSPYHDHHGMVVGNRDPGRHVTETTTIGWRPGCDCNHPAPWPKLPRRDKKETVESYVARCEPVWTRRKTLLLAWSLLPTVPCVVLDPFLGSGTTLQVARWLGRRGVGIERKAEYIAMARKRIAAPPQRPPVPKTHKPLVGQLPLFPGDQEKSDER